MFNRLMTLLVRLLPAVGLCGFALAQMKPVIEFNRRAVPATAIVQNSFMYRSGAAVSEVTFNGNRRSVTAIVRSWSRLPAQQPIAVLYDRSDPTRVVIQSADQLAPGVLALIVAIMIGFLEAARLASEFRRRRRLRNSSLAW